MTRRGTAICLFRFLLGVAAMSIALQASAQKITSYRLSAPGLGGTLGISFNNGPIPSVLMTSTEPGEAAESVARKLAGMINSDYSRLGVEIVDMTGDMADWAGDTVMTKIGLINFTCGTETGLGIVRAPLSLTANRNQETGNVHLVWENAEEYDKILLTGPVWGLAMLPGDASSATLDAKLLESTEFSQYTGQFGHLLCRLVATKDGLPTGPVDVEVRPKSMAELYRIPFSGPVAPNWSTWASPGLIAPTFRQGTRWEQQDSFVQHLIEKPGDAPYYQLIEARGDAVDGGIYRKFLGLVAGNRYRLDLRLNAFQASGEGDAELTVNGASLPYAAGDISELQMCGKLSLPPIPETAKFSEQVQISAKENWQQLSQVNTEDGALSVTVPSGCDTLHLWLRLRSAAGANVSVGMDWVELTEVE